jgi:hypothetical protein
MVIDYLNSNRLNEPTLALTVSEIAEKVHTDIVGTAIEDVNLLNEDLAITRAVPSLEFNGSQKPRQLDDIIADYQNGLPTIAWVGVGDAPYMWKHAVVITSVSRSHNLVRYNEPAKGIKEEKNLHDFMVEWDKVDNWLVRLILGRRDDRRLTEYPTVKVKAKK